MKYEKLNRLCCILQKANVVIGTLLFFVAVAFLLGYLLVNFFVAMAFLLKGIV